MRTPSPLYCRLDHVPPSADQFICGVAPSITARSFSSCPSDSTSRWTPCPPENCKAWLQVHLGCIRLSSLCPFRLLHTFRFLRPATYYRRFWIQRSSSERRRDLNPPDQCAAQRKVYVDCIATVTIPHCFSHSAMARTSCVKHANLRTGSVSRSGGTAR